MASINEKKEGDCGYVAFYNGKQIELYASGLYPAKVVAVKHFKPPKSKEHMISVILCERHDESPVLTDGASL